MFFVTHIFFKQLKRCHIIRPFHFYTCNKEFSLEHWKCFPAFKSSHRRYSVRIGLLRNFAKFTGKHLYQSLRPATLLKMRFWHRCFPVNFAKFLREPFYRKPPGDCLCRSSSEAMRDNITLLLMMNFKKCWTLKTYFGM